MNEQPPESHVPAPDPAVPPPAPIDPGGSAPAGGASDGSAPGAHTPPPAAAAWAAGVPPAPSLSTPPGYAPPRGPAFPPRPPSPPPPGTVPPPSAGQFQVHRPLPGATAPADYKTAGIFLVIGGVTTVIASITWIVFGLSCCCFLAVLWVPAAAAAVSAIVSGAQAIGGSRMTNLRLVNGLALAASILTCDWIVGVPMNVLALVWLSREEVSAWIEARD